MNTPIPFGYRLVRQGLAALPPACPPSYVAVAGCLCPAAIPSSESIPLYGTDFLPAPLAAKWNIPLPTATALFRFNEARYMQIDYASLTYRNLETARLALSTFFPDRPALLPLGHGALADALLTYHLLPVFTPFPPDARLLGFDIYAFGNSVPEGAPLPPLDFPAISTMGLGCPLLCSDPDAEIPARLGIPLNSRGLYPDAPSALAAADLVNRERLAEPSRYLPFALYQC